MKVFRLRHALIAFLVLSIVCPFITRVPSGSIDYGPSSPARARRPGAGVQHGLNEPYPLIGEDGAPLLATTGAASQSHAGAITATTPSVEKQIAATGNGALHTPAGNAALHTPAGADQSVEKQSNVEMAETGESDSDTSDGSATVGNIQESARGDASDRTVQDCLATTRIGKDSSEFDAVLSEVKNASSTRSKRLAVFFLVQHDPALANWFNKRHSGELLFFDSLKMGLDTLGWDVLVQTQRSDALNLVVQASKNPEMLSRMLFFVDIATATNFYNMPTWKVVRCRFRVLDFFGVPKSGESEPPGGLNLKQFMTPYPNPYNSLLGFIVEPYSGDVNTVKRSAGMLWGKQASYFMKHKELIVKLARLAPLHAVVEDVGALTYHVGEIPNLTVHKLMEPDSWLNLVATTKYMIGFGDPIGGPSVMHAISVGTTYLDCTFPVPRSLSSGVKYLSQHPYAASLGPPYAYSVHLENHTQVLETVRRVLDTKPFAPHVPYAMERNKYLLRLYAHLECGNFCS